LRIQEAEEKQKGKSKKGKMEKRREDTGGRNQNGGREK